MDRKEILAMVNKILSDKLGVKESQIKEESKLIDDLGADSLDLVDLVMAFEEEFGVKIADDKLQKISTVKDIVDYIVKAKA
ncbi:acyl carrier protein [Pseudothermotoga sp.]|uniref:acyl carrier protein n=1 Tax=Pseudothermotoga sp. TaxID=2033661 RepID=UPI002990B826|nr:acyl carrier protein [Pseudothermotoga sp.]MCX7812722.1 acyl carrier protein [Pseudothermotoga sp.]MDW8139002.1 acyl carrier protein [Pseudothermotoga sp.]